MKKIWQSFCTLSEPLVQKSVINSKNMKNEERKLFFILLSLALIAIYLSFISFNYNFLCWFIIMFWISLYIMHKMSILPKNTFTDKLLSEGSLAVKSISVFSIAVVYTPFFSDQLFILVISRLLVIIFAQYTFTGKINIKLIPFTLAIIIFTTYSHTFATSHIISFCICLLGLGGLISFIEEVFVNLSRPMNMNTRSSTNKNQEGDQPINVIIRRERHFPVEIHNKTPYAFFTQADVDTANQACEYVEARSKTEILRIAEEEIKPVLLSHKPGANIDLTYVQQATLKSIMTDPGDNKIKTKMSGQYNGTIWPGKFTLGGKNDLSLTGPTGGKTKFFEIFEQRVDDLKNDRFELRKV